MKKEMTYEAAMERLEQLARQMEAGEVPIDQLAVQLKEAQELLAYCREQLTHADEAVSKILDSRKDSI